MRGLVEDGGGIYTASSNGLTISGNALSGGVGYGIYLDDPTNNSIVENNTLTGPNDIGIFLHEVDNTIVRYNAVTGPWTLGYNPDAAGILVKNSASGTNSIYYNVVNCVDSTRTGITVGYAVNILTEIYNNVMTNCSQGLWIEEGYDNTVNNVKNNIFYNNTWHMYNFPGVAVSWNYNLYFPNTGTRFGYDSVAYNFANWKTQSGADANSPAPVDPMFVGASDFQLQPSSPAINAGVSVGLTVDYLGRPFVGLPDLGAYEYYGYVPGDIQGDFIFHTVPDE